MQLIRDGFDLIAGGGWNGLLMGGFLVLAATFVFAFILSKYFWIAIAVVAAALGL